jgi:hypothetical protein
MKRHIWINCLIVVLIVSCTNDKNDTPFRLEVAYDSIRSCPDCGGIFIIALTDSLTFTGNADLSLEAATPLNASMTRTTITRESPVTELVIEPAADIAIGDYEINLTASNEVYDTTLSLFVTVYDWSDEISEDPLGKMDEYIAWLEENYPGLNITADTEWDAYPTYPQILIVEHFTFLNDEFEFRICKHAMIPPYDWSMIRIRNRNEVTAFLAARQDSTGGDFYTIPVEEYPLMMGY